MGSHTYFYHGVITILILRPQYLRRLEIDEEEFNKKKEAENPGSKGDNLEIFKHNQILDELSPQLHEY